MVVRLGCALALIYGLDCAYAAWCGSRAGMSRVHVPFVLAAPLLILGALGALIEITPRPLWAVALLAGVLFAAVGYLAARRVPGAPLTRLISSPCREHPWPFDPVPCRARSVTHPPVVSMPLPAIGSVVELNQN